jgi:hypothetical protein
MPSLESRITKIEASIGTPRGWINGRDPALIDFLRWLCPTIGIAFDDAMAMPGVPGQPLINDYIDACSNHGRGLPSQSCSCEDCVRGITHRRIQAAFDRMFVPGTVFRIAEARVEISGSYGDRGARTEPRRSRRG